MIRVLITGGAGFIGTNLTNKLIHDGYEVIIIDDLSSGYRESIHDKAIFVEGSIVEDLALSKCFEYNPDYVIHLAANVGGLFKNMNYKVDMFEKNLMINYNVIKSCYENNVEKSILHKIILIDIWV